VYEAANALGVTVDAIRKRIQRGTIPHQRDEAGRVWVLLDAASSRQDAANSTVPDDGEYTYRPKDRDELVDSFKDQVEYLRQVIDTRDLELQRKDSIIAALTQRIPQLEPAAPPEASESHLTSSEKRGKGEASETEKEEGGLSWWRRIFG
jgi:hypothetical protein